jgi:transposase
MDRRATGVRTKEDALQSFRPMGGKGRLDGLVSNTCANGRASRPSSYRQFGGQGASLGRRRQRGEKNQAIGRSRGGRTTKIHALADAQCRPLAFMLSGGHVADCTAGAALLEQLPACDILHADKGYDANAIRRQVEDRGAMPNIPPKANRKWKNCFSPVLYRNRNAIERMFCRLKDFRRVATRYDRNAANFLAAISIAATVSYWL